MIKLLSSSAFNFYLCRYSLSNTFAGATVFNQPLTGWDTGRVTDMLFMLARTSAFNGAGLVGWNTSSVPVLVG
jgi:surface protein